ncbi:ABC transporter permease [Clostridium sp. 'deep sea']|uniref:ABC transporter permease n=1 Tax=Clostridium sp. 'deep sea' TaxID=2779445 RepID=UPI0018968A7A|nr:ABC transporter permease [Clostridium sp. 'deep sea']QOR36617.1 ABC transporter permease [Clostridium sp. 'deep sea']
MKFLEGFKISLSAIWAHKMRSFLTMLGIIIGISSVITVVSMGQGSRKSIEGNFEDFGVNRVIIYLNGRTEDVTNKDRLTEEDIKALQKNFSETTVAISPTKNMLASSTVNKKSANITISGVYDNYNSIEEKKILLGRYLNENDLQNRRDVIVIGEDLAEELFENSKTALGQRIFLDTGKKKTPATIIGIYEFQDSMFSGMNENYSAYMPYTTVNKVTGSSRYVNSVNINMASDVNVSAEMNKMISLLESRHKNAGEDKYRGSSAEEQLSMVNKVMNNITLLVSGIAAISLLVGGIGVMNIMLVSVTERTREIGIRKAIGARRRDILIQFILEAILLTMGGGIIGTILGLSGAYVIAGAFGIPRVISVSSILIAWAFSALIGLFFGSYPANKAAKLDPIEALRFE